MGIIGYNIYSEVVMGRDGILDIFYNEIVKEASKGRIDCYFYYNIIFSTKVNNEYIEAYSDIKDILIPTLNISNKELFDNLLVDYAMKALNFYSNKDFNRDAIDSGISREKIVLTMLWSNATWEDFMYPCNYFRRRINFFNNNINEDGIIGKSSYLLNSNISYKIVKNKLENETPYRLELYLNSSDSDDIYKLPNMYFGISDDIVYIYAMQNDRDSLFMDSMYKKKISRLLRHVDSGLDVKNETFGNYDEGNLKDITPSFLVGANIGLGLFKSMGYNKIMVSSVLPERWNGKMIAADYKLRHGVSINDIDNLKIQRNLTEKFIRTFNRLIYHHSGINSLNSVGEDSSYLIISIDDNDVCNNELLNETYNIGINNVKKGK